MSAHRLGLAARVCSGANYSDPAINANTIELNRAMDTAARPFHVVIANGFASSGLPRFRIGHQPCVAGLITQLNGQAGSCGIHPSYAGQTLLAHALEKVIRF